MTKLTSYVFLVRTKRYFSLSSQKFQEKLKLNYTNGSIQILVPLITKQDKCLFTLKPVNDTVANFMDYLKQEDKGIERAQIYNLDGQRISSNTSIGQLSLLKAFNLKINDLSYTIEPELTQSQTLTAQSIDNKDFVELKNLISKLYINLNMDEFESKRRDDLLKKLEVYKQELEPLERHKEELSLKAKRHTNRMIWLGLGLMSLQGGVLARLTWFDYSWDIVEPISYFVTYSAVVGVYAYFVLTRKEYDYESASDRIFLRYFHKNAIKNKLDVQKYNSLKENIYKVELSLKNLDKTKN